MKNMKSLSWLGGMLLVVLALLMNACSTSSNSADAASTSQGVGTTATSQQQSATTSMTTTTNSLPTQSLKQIRMTDATHGWALDNDNILKTSDGGKSWVALTPKGAAISASTQADFLNAQYAWFTLPGNTGTTIYHTTTGGTTWNSSLVQDGGPDGGTLTFVSNQTGWLEVAPGGAGAGSEAVDILRTDDGGASWNKISSSGQGANSLPTGGIKSGLSFVNTATGWATGEDASNTPWFYMTHDGGKTWYQKSISGLNNNSSMYQTLPPVIIGNYGFLPVSVSGSANSTVLARSTDGGANWTTSGQQIAPFQSNNVYVINTQAAWATDQNTGDVYQTTNSGASWQKAASGTGVFGPLSIVNTTTGFGLGHSNSGQANLERTDDGGKTWQTISYQIHG